MFCTSPKNRWQYLLVFLELYWEKRAIKFDVWISRRTFVNLGQSKFTLSSAREIEYGVWIGPYKYSNEDAAFLKQENETIQVRMNKKLCEGLLTEKCLQALSRMETDKIPGTDGLPAEFYKIFRILEILTLELLILHTIKVNCQSLREGVLTN